MSFLEDFRIVNKATVARTADGIKRNWYIGLAGFVYTLASFIFFFISSYILRGPFSILSGILTSLFSSALLSNYLCLLELTILGQKISYSDFKEGFKHYVWKIYGVFFLLYIVEYLFSLLGRMVNSNVLLFSQLVYLSFFVLFNALPETIYLKNFIPVDTLRYSLEFMKENWVQWAIPNILVFLILYGLSRGLSSFMISKLGVLKIVEVVKSLLRTFFMQSLVAIFMIYRGNLFYVLTNSTRRNRKFKFGE